MITSAQTTGTDDAASLSPRRHIIVVGLGNLIRSDDGVGVHAMHRLVESPRLPSDPSWHITFIDGGTRSLELVSDAADASHMLILDAVDADAPPGTLIRLNGSDLASLPAGCSVHQLGIVDWLGALVMLRGRAPEIRVLGVQPVETGWGTTLTTPIRLGLERLVDAAIEQLEEWMAE